MLARRYGIINGLLPAPAGRGVAHRISLESVLILGGAFFVAGIVGVIYGVRTWAQSSFGPVEGPFLLRLLIISLTAMAAGLQLATLAFLTGLIDIPIARRPPPVS